MYKKIILGFVLSGLSLGLFLINQNIARAADCATEFGNQGYSCMEASSGRNCKVGYCPGTANNIQCCQPGLGILPEASGPIMKYPDGTTNCPSGYTAEQCGLYTVNDFIALAINVSKWIFGIVGSLALIMFIYGGFMFLISAGSADTVGKAKKIIIAAAIGLVIVFSSYLIIQFVLKSMGLNWDGTIKVPEKAPIARALN
ncbi:MAG: hypothetical protein WC456_03340 [Patescibacteria group bacterium]